MTIRFQEEVFYIFAIILDRTLSWSFVIYMGPLFSSEKIAMIICGLFLSAHLTSISNYNSHSVKTICLEMQKGKRALALLAS